MRTAAASKVQNLSNPAGSGNFKLTADSLGTMEAAVMTTLTEIDISSPRAVFEAWDRNGDGFIDSDEFRALLQELDGDVTRAECQLNFEAVDTEGDGYIGFKEFVAWWTN